ncbi:unannotated protein [freshwater metagenome]
MGVSIWKFVLSVVGEIAIGAGVTLAVKSRKSA